MVLIPVPVFVALILFCFVLFVCLFCFILFVVLSCVDLILCRADSGQCGADSGLWCRFQSAFVFALWFSDLSFQC